MKLISATLLGAALTVFAAAPAFAQRGGGGGHGGGGGGRGGGGHSSGSHSSGHSSGSWHGGHGGSWNGGNWHGGWNGWYGGRYGYYPFFGFGGYPGYAYYRPYYRYPGYYNSSYYYEPYDSWGWLGYGSYGAGYGPSYGSAYGGAYNQPYASAGSTAQIEVRLPDPNGDVWLDGQKTQQNGPTRTFVTPRLEPGSYSYQVSAAWHANGRLLTQERTVTFQPGNSVLIDFTQTAPAPAPRPLQK